MRKILFLLLFIFININCQDSKKNPEVDKLEKIKKSMPESYALCESLLRLKGNWDGEKYRFEICSDYNRNIQTYPKNPKEQGETYSIISVKKNSENKYTLVAQYLSELTKDEIFEVEFISDDEIKFKFYKDLLFFKKIK